MAYQFDNAGKLVPPKKEALVEADSDSYMLVLSQGILKTGEPYWAYVAIKPSKYREFVAKTKAGQKLIINNYGKVIKCGGGKQVPVEIQEEMKAEHGFDETHIDKIAAKIKDAKTAHVVEQEEKRIRTIVAVLKENQKQEEE